jgi:hypothetical protein
VEFRALFLNSDIAEVELERGELLAPDGHRMAMVRSSSSRSQTFRADVEVPGGGPWPAGQWEMVFFAGGVEWDRYRLELTAVAAAQFGPFPEVPRPDHGGDPRSVFLASYEGSSRIVLSPGSDKVNAPGGSVYRYPTGDGPFWIDRASLVAGPLGSVAGLAGKGPTVAYRRSFESEIRFIFHAVAPADLTLQLLPGGWGPHLELAGAGLVAGRAYFLRDEDQPGAGGELQVIEAWSNAFRIPRVRTGERRFFRLAEAPDPD